MKKFSVNLSLYATPTNNVQIAFGCDLNADGALSDKETDFTLAWDCGNWEVNHHVLSPSVTTNDMKNFLWSLDLKNNQPISIQATENTIPLQMSLQEIGALFNPSWNVMSVTARGLDNPHEQIQISSERYGFNIRVR